MSSTKTYYPSFVPNQVLTDTQLNDLREYLDEQGRITRTRLIGTGIVCGLHAHYTFSEPKTGKGEYHTIYLSEGYGISSDGYLIEVKAGKYTRFREYLGIDEDGDYRMDYPHWANARKSIWELVPEDDADMRADVRVERDTNRIKPLEEQYIRDHVLVAFIEQVDEDLRSCRITDCSNKGAQTHLVVKLLLVHESDLTGFSRPSPLADQMLHIQRFFSFSGFKPKAPGERHTYPAVLSDIATTDDIRNAYGHLAFDAIDEIKDRLNAMASDTELRAFLQLKPGDLAEIAPPETDQEDPLQDLLESLGNIFVRNKSKDDYNQYHYDFVRDLFNAWNEFWVAWHQLVQTCSGATGYERHLMIRRFESRETGDGTYYRNNFAPTPVRNQMYQDWELTRKLALRIMFMIGFFDRETVDTLGSMSRVPEIKITPGQSPFFALGEQSIPFYYNWGENNTRLYSFPELWQPLMPQTAAALMSYHYTALERDTDYLADPLRYDLNKLSFLKIEGHIGKTPGVVMDFLRTKQANYNLDFDVLVFYLADSMDEVRDPLPGGLLYSEYADQLKGMEHISGVAPGDTFILIADPRCPGFEDDIVVADFTLKGKISCCLLGETNVDNTYHTEPHASVEVTVVDEEGYLFGDVRVTLADNKGTHTQTTPSQTRPDGSQREGIVIFEKLVSGQEYFVTAQGDKGGRSYISEGEITGNPAKVTATNAGAEIVIKMIAVPEVITDPVVDVHFTDIADIRGRGFEVEEEDTSPPPGKVNNLTSRRQSRITAVYDLNSKGDYQRNRTYQSAQEFVSSDKLKAKKLSDSFKDTIGKLKSVYKRASGKKEKDYQTMLELTFLSYMDRLVETAPASLPTEAKEILASEMKDIEEYGISPAKLKRSWKAAEVKKSSDAKVIDQINRLLK